MLIIQRSGRGTTRREQRRRKLMRRKGRGNGWEQNGKRRVGTGQQEWLEYDEEEKVMFCTWCKMYEPKAESVWCIKQMHQTNNSKAAAYIDTCMLT